MVISALKGKNKMVALETIAQATGVPDPDLDTIFSYLDQVSGPVATDKKPLRIIAPAVNQLHVRAKDIQSDLGAPVQKMKRKIVIVRAFKRVTDYYVILKGINPPVDPVQRIEFKKEIEFAKKLIGIVHRLLREIGGENIGYDEQLNLAASIRNSYASELKNLKDEYPFPEFARKEKMVRQSIAAANVSWIFFIIYILAKLGVLSALIHAIVELFRGVIDLNRHLP